MSTERQRDLPLAPAPPGGWQLLALTSEITGQVTGLSLGSRALVAIRDEAEGKVRVFDGTCPHRGAHLGFGGRVASKQIIICPFHGKRIWLGAGTGRLCVREHQAIDSEGAIFVRLSDVPARDHGFGQAMKEILATHVVMGAVVGEVAVPPELIIENAFDFTHFPAVHLIPRLDNPRVWLGDEGELNITTAFHTQAPDWESAKGDFTSHFHARAFNPNLVVSELGSGSSSKYVITGAVPAPAGCVVRIAVAVRREEAEKAGRELAAGSQISFEQDLIIWENLDLTAPIRLDAGDAPVLAFRAFCASFAAPPTAPGQGEDTRADAREPSDSLTAAGRTRL